MIGNFIVAAIVLCFMVDTVINDGVWMNGVGTRPSRRIPRRESARLYYTALIFYGVVIFLAVYFGLKRRR